MCVYLVVATLLILVVHRLCCMLRMLAANALFFVSGLVHIRQVDGIGRVWMVKEALPRLISKRS